MRLPSAERYAAQVEAFRAALSVDDATWRRGRGWALWKALITLAGQVHTHSSEAAQSRAA